jgi:hypothetical protein
VAGMMIFYRCAMCSPNQSRSVHVLPEDPPLSVACYLVEMHHKQVSPDCPASKDPKTAVDILLVRMVQ